MSAVDRALHRHPLTRTSTPVERRSSQPIPPPWQDGLASAAGVTVTPDTAVRHAAVWACRDLIARLVAMMPAGVYRDTTGLSVPVKSLPKLFRQPSPHPQLTFRHWVRQVIDSALAYGNAYGIVQGWENGWPATVEIMPGWRVLPTELMRLGYGTDVTWKVDGQPVDLWENGGRLWHLPAYVSGGSPVGMSPVEAARQAIGLGLAAQLFGGRFFGDDGHPTAAIMAPKEAGMLSDGQIQDIKTAYMRATTGNREPVVLGGGLTYQPLQIAPNESQFLETISANVATVCMFYGVPPEAIGGTSGDSMTYANVEGRNLLLLVNTIGAWLVWLEDALTRMLPRPMYVRFNPGVLLKTSVKTQYDALAQAVAGGLLTQNEAREKLELQPMDGADVLLTPMAKAPPTPAGVQGET